MNRNDWLGNVQIYYKPEKFVHDNNSTIFLKNYRAVEKEISELIALNKLHFRMKIADTFNQTIEEAILKHFFLNERKIYCFVTKVFLSCQELLKLWEIDYLYRLIEAEDCLDSDLKQCKKNLCIVGIDFSSELGYPNINLREIEGECFDLCYSHRINREICSFGGIDIQPIFAAMLDPELQVQKRFLTDNVVNVAKAIYDSKDWASMPILADALQDAGCNNKKIIQNCQNGNHFRGCKVLDSILNKG